MTFSFGRNIQCSYINVVFFSAVQLGVYNTVIVESDVIKFMNNISRVPCTNPLYMYADHGKYTFHFGSWINSKLQA